MSHENSPDVSERISPITRLLAKAPSGVLIAYGGIMAFGTYFCMYAFRRPFAAVEYTGSGWQFGLQMKTVFVLSQVIGYMISKYLGIKVCSEITKKYRLPILIGMILWAEAALILFGLMPVKLKFIAIFLNGLPLGMVWGVCVLYIEGRKITEFLLAGMACSYIVASGYVKTAGLSLLNILHCGDFWMPAITGLVFLPPFLLFAWLLSKMPPPTAEDEELRTHRQPMTGREKIAFLKFFWVGVVLQLALYFFITAFRDVRDFYQADILGGLGYDYRSRPAIFKDSERLVGLAALAALVIIKFFDSKKWGVIPNLTCQALGFLILGGSTLALQGHYITGFQWMVLIGVGGYLAYVPCDTIFYERVIARAGWVSTAVFMTYVMDAFGYTGSVALQLYKNLGAGTISWAKFFIGLSYFLTIAGLIVISINMFYFPYRARVRRRMIAQGQAPAVPSQAS